MTPAAWQEWRTDAATASPRRELSPLIDRTESSPMRTMQAENQQSGPAERATDGEPPRHAAAALFDGPDGLSETVRFFERLGKAGLWSWQVASGEMSWSRGVYELLDIEPGSAAPSFRQLLAMMHPEDRLRDVEIDALVARGLPIDRQFRLILGNGRLRVLEMKGEVLFDASGKPLKAVGLFFDTTARQELLRLARSEADRYLALRDLVSDLVVLTRGDGVVIEGPKWRSLTGQDTARAATWLDAVHLEDAAHALALWRQAAVNGAPFAGEFRLVDPDGVSRHVLARGAPIKSRNGAVREWAIVFTDMHEQAARREQGETLALTGAQIRAARAILNWSVRDLSDVSGVSISTIRRMEEFDGTLTTLRGRLGEVKAALERSGVEFVSFGAGKPGVRPR